jgi:hypothetical protein
LEKEVKLVAPSIHRETEVAKAAIEQKSQRIDAAILRIMKAKKIMKSTDLDAEVREELAAQVHVSTDDVRRSVESLYAKRYLEQTTHGRVRYVQ